MRAMRKGKNPIRNSLYLYLKILFLQFIDFMGSNLNDEKIRIYLDNCRHRDDRELDNNTPDGFWNPHMVSFDEADPRNEVIVDRRFVDQRKKWKQDFRLMFKIDWYNFIQVQIYKLPRLACSISMAVKSDLKLPAPNPWNEE